MRRMWEHIKQLDFFHLIMGQRSQIFDHGFSITAGIQNKVRSHFIEKFGERLTNASTRRVDDNQIGFVCLSQGKICQSRDISPFSGLTSKFHTIEDKCRLKRLKTAVSNNNKVVQIVEKITALSL